MKPTSSSTAASLFELHRRAPRFTVRNVLETLAVLGGAKPVLRLVLAEPEISAVRAGLASLGLETALSDWKLAAAYSTSLGDVFTRAVPLDAPNAGDRVVAVSGSPALAADYLHAERSDDAALVGLLLGYPSCCVASYEHLASDYDWLTHLLLANPSTESHPFECNRIAYLFDEEWIGFDYFPCSLDCGPTQEVFGKVARVLHECGLDEFVERICARMRAPVLITRGVVVQLRQARREGGRVVFDLSRARVHGWRVEERADEDPVWGSDSASREDGRLCFRCGERLLASRTERSPGTRLLLFS